MVRAQYSVEMMRRLLCFIGLVWTVLSVPGLDFEAGVLRYRVRDDGAWVVGTTSADVTSVTIDARVSHDGKTYAIRGIERAALAHLTMLQSVDMSHAGYCAIVGDSALACCTQLTTIRLGEGLTRLGDDVLAGTGIATLRLPASLRGISAHSFAHMAALTAIDVAESSPTFAAGSHGALVSRDHSIVHRFPPAAAMTTLTLDERWRVIDTCAFAEQQHLTAIEIGPEITTVMPRAFEAMPQLQWLQLSGSTTLARDGAGLTAGSPQLHYVMLNRSYPPALAEDAFAGADDELTLIVPVGATGNYLRDSAMRAIFGDRIVSGSYDFVVDDVAYSQYATMPKTAGGVRYDGGSVRVVKCYNPHRGLISAGAEATAPATLRMVNPEHGGRRYYCDEVGDSAYRLNAHLTTIIDESGNLGWVRPCAFEGCSGLRHVELPSIRYYYTAAFAGCTRLTDVDFERQHLLLRLYSRAFADCTALTSVTIDSAFVSSIDSEAFAGCTALRTLRLPATHMLRTVGEAAFTRCDLREVHLPHGVTTVATDAFAENAELSTLLLPSSVTTFAPTAMRDCPTLQHLAVNLATVPSDLADADLTASLGTTLHEGLIIHIPVGASGAWSATLPSLADHLGEGGAYDFAVSHGADDNYYYTITRDATDGRNGECSLVRSRDNVRLCAAHINIPASVDDQGLSYTVSAIGAGALASMGTRLETVQWTEDLKTLGDSAMAGSAVHRVGDDVSRADSHLTGVQRIGHNAFAGCDLHGTLDISDAIVSIGAQAFVGNSGLERIVMRRFDAAVPYTSASPAWDETNGNLQVYVHMKCWEEYTHIIDEWGETALRRLVPYVAPTVEYQAASINCGVDLSAAAVGDDVEFYYVNEYRGNHAMTVRIDGAVPAGSGFIIRGLDPQPRNTVGGPAYRLPRIDGAIAPLPDNLLVGVPSTNFITIEKNDDTNYYILNSDGTFTGHTNGTLRLYASCYLPLPAEATSHTPTMRLDLVAPYIPGDVNDDSRLNSTDLGALVNIIAGTESADSYPGLADVNGDGRINAGDIAALVNLIAGL